MYAMITISNVAVPAIIAISPSISVTRCEVITRSIRAAHANENNVTSLDLQTTVSIYSNIIAHVQLEDMEHVLIIILYF
jgi:hypothetical protein